ncbi:hypothetical protein WOLCODRAFT_157012 [Wolfiporia cocos MD-104 SS10]|uniref:Uncharacterized protein n=1 Tax=Wolfiporia cocos (strain MD-104) TaxID=742152 RepID=A0A2H3JF33_WOLCO|nr:hypothetical protein WOLCODRAFT_157012 [Wolfiporia cocos MD-104 SS10]
MEEATQLMIAAIKAQTSQSPLRTFAIAYIHDLEDIASKSAEEVERQQLCISYVDELETIPAKAYIRLLDFCMVKKTPRPYTFCHGSNISQQQSSVQTPLPGARATRNASPPLDDLPGADIIIRTSDMVEFRVHRVILNMGAPGLLRISPTPYQHSPDSSDNGIPSSNALPLLQLAEKCETISTLLRMCYPCDSPILLSNFDALYTAAKKYSMQMVMDRLRHELINLLKGCDDSEPYYLLACRHSFKDIVYKSAKAFSERDLGVWIAVERKPKSIWRQSFDAVPASAVFRLLQFHRKTKAEALALTSKWVPKPHRFGNVFDPTTTFDAVANACQLPAYRPSRYPCWLSLFMSKVRPVLEEKPRGSSIRDKVMDILLDLQGELLNAQSKQICTMCRRSITTEQLKRMVRDFADKVDEVANKVNLPSAIASSMVIESHK